MKRLLIGVATVAALTLPVATLAATYQYVNTSGNLETETADNAEQALLQPTDRAPDSGVILDDGSIVGDSPPAPVNNGITGTYGDVLTGIGTQARTILLTLMPDGTVAMTSFYNNTATPMIESGTWTGVGNGQVQVTLTSTTSGLLATPDILVFNQSGSTLVATSFNSSLYGTQGLSFTKE